MKHKYGEIKKGDLAWEIVVILHGDFHEGMEGVMYVPYGNSKETWKSILKRDGYDVKNICLSTY